MTSNEIGLRVKKLREEKGYTLEEVGRFLNVSRATVQRYESGVITKIPSDKVELLANLFNVSPGYIMGWTAKDNTDANDDIELQLLSLFRKLNTDGQEYVLEQARYALGKSFYVKKEKSAVGSF